MHKLGYLLKRMEGRGISTQTLLAESGIQLNDLRHPTYTPSVTQYRVVVRKIVELSPPGIGIAMGLETTILDEGPLGYALLSSATLRDVNALVERYYSL